MSEVVQPPVKAFADLLRAEDEQGRKRLLSQANMLAMADAPPESFDPPIQTLGDYLDAPIEVPPVLVHPYIIVRGGIACTVGRAGKGKTVMNLNRMLRWGAGKPWFSNWKDSAGEVYLCPEKPLKILIIENEGAAGLFHRNIGIMLNNGGYLTPDERALAKENILIWGDGGYSNLKLDDPNALANVRAGCEKWEPDIVFLEPFRKLWKGEENSATEMAVVVDALSGIASEYQCGVLVAHHERKAGVGDDGEKMSAGRGSSVLEGEVAQMENFEAVKAGEYRELSWSKSRYAVAPPTVRMEWDGEAWWYKHVPLDAVAQTIIEALQGNNDEPMSIPDLMDETGEKRNKLSPVLAELVKEGRLKKTKSQHSGTGSTGAMYRLVSGDNDGGGLAI